MHLQDAHHFHRMRNIPGLVENIRFDGSLLVVHGIVYLAITPCIEICNVDACIYLVEILKNGGREADCPPVLLVKC